MKFSTRLNPLRPLVKKSKSGVSRIVRDTYSSGVKNGWWEIRKEVWARDAGMCIFCGAPGSEVHHITPLSKGGTTTKANLATICKPCHDKRHRHLFRSRK